MENLFPEKDPEVPIPNIPASSMVLVSDLPDEQRARSIPMTRQLSELELKLRYDEEQIKVQKEILNFLRKNWQEVSKELKDTEHEWPAKVAYYSTRSFL